MANTQRLNRARLLATAMLVGGVLVAGCGARSTTTATSAGLANAMKSTTGVRSSTGVRSTIGHGTAAGSATAAGSGTIAPSGTAVGGGAPSGLAFSKCMRANGVPNFPDPQPGGGLMFRVSPGEINSPARRHAQATCVKYLPGGGPNGPGGPGAPTHPTAQEMASMRRISVCMRSHGISQFPDPRTSVPASAGGLLPPGINELSNINDVILLFPSSINQQSPAFVQAANACGFPLHNH
jgi:hypothetical protein